MVNDLHTFLYASLSGRISSVVVAGMCILCSLPQPATCLSINKSEELVSESNSDQLIERFNDLEEVVQLSGDPLDDGRNFLQSFIGEINAKYGLNLTIQQACVLVRENLHSLQIPVEAQNILLETMALLECDSHSKAERMHYFEKVVSLNAVGLNLSWWPWAWNWFGLNKKNYQRSKQSLASSFVSSPLLQVPGTGQELPGTVYVGGVEAFAGALVFTLGLVFPPAYAVGTALMVDGTRRVLNGIEEVDKQRFPSSNQSSGPFSVNF